MDNFREKSQVFVLGMMTGLVIAGSFFILKLDDYFKELNVYKNVAKTFYLRSKSHESEVLYQSSEKQNTSGELSSKSKNKKNQLNETNTMKSDDAMSYTDSLNTYGYPVSEEKTTGDEEIVVVRKDEMQTSKLVEVINLNQLSSNTNDSLLQKVSGIRDDKNVAKQLFNVELWQSPLNYKGYKMSKSKLVLYGMPVAEGLKLYKMDDDVYLKGVFGVYKLEYSNEFGAYQTVNDASIVSKLK